MTVDAKILVSSRQQIIPVFVASSHVSAILAGVPGTDGSIYPKTQMIHHVREGSTAIYYIQPALTFGFLDANSHQHIKRVTINGQQQVRLIVMVGTDAASVVGSRMKLMYKTGTYSTTGGDYTNLAATGECAAPLDLPGTNTPSDSGWVNLPYGLAGDIWLAYMAGGGNLGDTINVPLITVYFR